MKYEDEIREAISAAAQLTATADQIPADVDLQNAGMNSLTLIAVIVEIENKFNIEFPDDRLVISSVGTIKALCETVASIIGE